MALTLKLGNITLNVSDFYFNRTHGDNMHISANVVTEHRNAEKEKELADYLMGDAPKMEIQWEDKPLLPEMVFSKAKSLKGDVSSIWMKGFYNQLPEYQPGPLVPRRRVLKADTFLKLLEDNFSEIICWDNSVKFALDNVSFPDDKKTNHIQHGISDFEMLKQLLCVYNHMEAPENALTLTGAPSDKKLQLNWLQESKYHEENLVQDRKIDDLIPETVTTSLSFGGFLNPPPYLFNQKIKSKVVAYTLNWGEFDADKWDAWNKKDLPVFFQDKFVYEINDHLTFVGDHLTWKSYLNVLPEKTLLDYERVPLIPWGETGTIEKRSPKGQWMEAKLAGYENGADQVDVRITTPYSGKDGNKGFHLVPEENTEVYLVKGVNWQSPIFCMGNTRTSEIVQGAPFWQLEELGKWSFNDLSIDANKVDMNHQSNLTIHAKNINISSDKKISTNASEITNNAGKITNAAEEELTLSSSKNMKMNGTEVNLEGKTMVSVSGQMVKLN